MRRRGRRPTARPRAAAAGRPARADLRRLVAADTTPDKVIHLAQLAALYREAVAFAERSDVRTAGDLAGRIRAAAAALLPADALIGVRKRIADEIARTLPWTATSRSTPPPARRRPTSSIESPQRPRGRVPVGNVPAGDRRGTPVPRPEVGRVLRRVRHGVGDRTPPVRPDRRRERGGVPRFGRRGDLRRVACRDRREPGPRRRERRGVGGSVKEYGVVPRDRFGTTDLRRYDERQCRRREHRADGGAADGGEGTPGPRGGAGGDVGGVPGGGAERVPGAGVQPAGVRVRARRGGVLPASKGRGCTAMAIVGVRAGRAAAGSVPPDSWGRADRRTASARATSRLGSGPTRPSWTGCSSRATRGHSAVSPGSRQGSSTGTRWGTPTNSGLHQ